jgi:antitoxin component YwqK of YwqJK toxin-antitoxin module
LEHLEAQLLKNKSQVAMALVVYIYPNLSNIVTVIKLFIFLLCFSVNSFACNTSEHHSVLSHYNHAQKIFEGKVLKVGKEGNRKHSFLDKKTGIRGVLARFEVVRRYKDCEIKEEVTIGILPNSYAKLELGESYLIYANRSQGYGFLVCEKAFALKDTLAIKKHLFLFEIPYQYNGPMVEYSDLGLKWAEGMFINGLAIGGWTYYAKSGEVQQQGNYKKGEEEGEWFYFYHTKDESYQILNQIFTGDYYKKTGSYKLIRVDSNLLGKFTKKIKYVVGLDTLEEAFRYRDQLVSKKVNFQSGLRDGKEQQFKEDGSCFSSYTFEKEVLEGGFFMLQKLRGQEDGYLKAEGDYKVNEKYNETHFYYEKGQLSQTRVVIKEGQVL